MNEMPADPFTKMTPFREGVETTRAIFDAYVSVGFSEEQSFVLLMAFLDAEVERQLIAMQMPGKEEE
jgi:hypothetical protein